MYAYCVLERAAKLHFPSSPDVPAGTYVLSVISHDHTFDPVCYKRLLPSPPSSLTMLPQLRIDVYETDTLPEVRPYIPGTPLSPASTVSLPYPIGPSATQKLDYYTQQQAFNLVAMFKNPMMMMMLVGGALVFAMPYLMACSFSNQNFTMPLTHCIEKYGP